MVSSKIRKDILLFLGGFLTIIIIAVGYGYISYSTLKSSVKGTSTSTSPTPTTIPTLSPTYTPTLAPTIKPVSYQKQPTLQTKQYGGWYWQSDLNLAQVWIGTDSAGKDIWADGIPTPTSTPTPKTVRQQLSTQGRVSNASEASSVGNMTQAKEVETKIIEKK